MLAFGMENAVAIDAGAHGTCAVTSKQEVWCWGQLGGEGGYLARPTRLPALAGATTVRVEYNRVCGLIADKVSCLSFPSEG